MLITNGRRDAAIVECAWKSGNTLCWQENAGRRARQPIGAQSLDTRS